MQRNFSLVSGIVLVLASLMVLVQFPSQDMTPLSDEEESQIVGGQMPPICAYPYIRDYCRGDYEDVGGKGAESCPGTPNYGLTILPGGVSTILGTQCTTPCGAFCGTHTIAYLPCGNPPSDPM